MLLCIYSMISLTKACSVFLYGARNFCKTRPKCRQRKIRCQYGEWIHAHRII